MAIYKKLCIILNFNNILNHLLKNVYISHKKHTNEKKHNTHKNIKG